MRTLAALALFMLLLCTQCSLPAQLVLGVDHLYPCLDRAKTALRSQSVANCYNLGAHSHLLCRAHCVRLKKIYQLLNDFTSHDPSTATRIRYAGQ